jgi:hypothetical protein
METKRDLTPQGFNPAAMGRLVGRHKSVLFPLLAAVPMLFILRSPSFGASLLPVPVSTVPSNGDLNPYGVQFIAAPIGGALNAGDLLISNFNNSANVMGTGTTIVDIRAGQQLAHPFYTAPAAFKGLDLALRQVDELIVVGNVPVTGSKAGPGALTILNDDGVVLNRITGSYIDGPWGLAFGPGNAWYVSNLLDGTVWRLDVTASPTKGFTVSSATQIGGGYLTAIDFPSAANGPAGLALDPTHNILYVASEVDNEIFSISDASTRGTTTEPGTVVYSDTTHLHGPTGLRLLANGDLLTANDDGVNTTTIDNPSAIIEFTPSAPDGKFVAQYQVDPNPGGAFGLNTSSSGDQTLLGYVDDNTATASVLSLFFVP